MLWVKDNSLSSNRAQVNMHLRKVMYVKLGQPQNINQEKTNLKQSDIEYKKKLTPAISIEARSDLGTT